MELLNFVFRLASSLGVFENPADGQRGCEKLLISGWKLIECFSLKWGSEPPRLGF
jgi:hypothetical protein